jgi:hypothetical protein
MPPMRDGHVGAGRRTERGESIAQGPFSAPVAGTGGAGTIVPKDPTVAVLLGRDLRTVC